MGMHSRLNRRKPKLGRDEQCATYRGFEEDAEKVGLRGELSGSVSLGLSRLRKNVDSAIQTEGHGLEPADSIGLVSGVQTVQPAATPKAGPTSPYRPSK